MDVDVARIFRLRAKRLRMPLPPFWALCTRCGFGTDSVIAGLIHALVFHGDTTS